MPDPMKSTDIEDVLSSIRRLVSYDPANLQPTQAPKPAQPDRLVLTPALRVNEAKPKAAPVAVEAPAQEADEERSEVVQAAFIRRVEPAANDAPAPSAALSQSLEDRIADLEAAVSQVGEDWEPDGSEAEANVYPTSYPVIEPPRRSRMHLSEPESERIDAPQVEAAPAPVAVAPAAEPEAVVVPSPVAEVAKLSAPEVMEDLDDSSLDDDVDAILNKAEEKTFAAMSSISACDLDQAQLRDLVRQMIREEFQGVLGERITRNVRKLVRREINRALVSKEFE